MVDIAILNHPHGQILWSGTIRGAADIHAAASAIDAHAVSIAVRSGGAWEQVHVIDQIGRVSPLCIPAGAAIAATDAGHAEQALRYCREEIERGKPERAAAAPHYRIVSDAADDGWFTYETREEYRGWMIVLYYRLDWMRAIIRQRSGHGPRGLQFRTIRAPQLPETHPVVIDQQLNKIGHRHNLNRLARQSDVSAYMDACRELIDSRLDGRRDIDMAET